MCKVLLFDFFDVLYTDLYRAWLETHEYKREGAFLNIVQSLDEGIISVGEFYQKLGDIVDSPAADVRVEMESGATCNQELLAYIEKLHSTYKTGLISNAASSFIRPILQKHDIERYFDEIIISAEVGAAKPDPRIFQTTLDRFQVLPEEVLFIDDNSANIAAAQAMEIRGIQYTDNASLLQSLQLEDVTLD